MNFEELSKLQAGWYEHSYGKSYDAKKVERIYSYLFDRHLRNLPKPQIIPTQDGNLLFSWEHFVHSPTLDYDLTTNMLYFHAFDDDNSDIEFECNIRDRKIVKKIFKYLTSIL